MSQLKKLFAPFLMMDFLTMPIFVKIGQKKMFKPWFFNCSQRDLLRFLSPTTNSSVATTFWCFSPFKTFFLPLFGMAGLAWAKTPCSSVVRQELVARGTGILSEIHVSDESRVEQGALILALDSRLLAVGLKEAQAALDMTRIGEKLAKDAFERIKKLKGGDSVSQQQVVESSLKLAQARAAVSQAEAAVERLQIQLEDSRIKAEMSGVVRGLPRVKGLFVQFGQSLGYIESDTSFSLNGEEGCGRH